DEVLDVLGVAPDRRLVRLHVGDTAGRSDRGVTLVVMGKGTRHHVGRRLQRGVDVADLEAYPRRDLALRIEVAIVLPEVAVAREDRIVVVCDLERRGRLDRVVLLRRDD